MMAGSDAARRQEDDAERSGLRPCMAGVNLASQLGYLRVKKYSGSLQGHKTGISLLARSFVLRFVCCKSKHIVLMVTIG